MDAPPVQYVTTSDGYRIAYTVCGEGEPFVLMPEEASHVQLAWAATIQSKWLEGLKERFRLVCYDGRGQGMSQRGLKAFSLADGLRDLVTVVDHLGLQRFILSGQRYNGHVAIQYAVANPERIAALILVHCSLSAYATTKVQLELGRENWEHTLVLVSGVLQGDDRDATLNFLRRAVTQQDWLAMAEGIGVSEIGGVLPGLRVPTLLLHSRGYAGLKEEEASELAAKIPGANLVLTEGSSSRIDAVQGLQAIDAFLTGLPAPAAPVSDAARDIGSLSAREVEVLRLLAAGKSNQQIADELVISINTANRHVSNIYAKIGAANRTEAAGYATRNGIA